MNDTEPQPANSDFERGQRLIEIGRFAQAAESLTRALALEPEHPGIHFELARALADGDEPAALEHLEQAIALQPEWAAPQIFRGGLLMNQGRHREAEQALLEGLRLAPNSSVAFELYGDLMVKTDRLDKGVQLLRRSLAIDPENASAHASLARLEAFRKRPEQALEHGRKGVSLDPQGPFEHAQLGYAYLTDGRPFRARAHLREALRQNPSSEFEQAYLEADKLCRWTMLPAFLIGRQVDRLPGSAFTLWGAFLLLMGVARGMDPYPAWANPVAIVYVAWCVYSWLATPLTALWVRLVPAQ